MEVSDTTIAPPVARPIHGPLLVDVCVTEVLGTHDDTV